MAEPVKYAPGTRIPLPPRPPTESVRVSMGDVDVRFGGTFTRKVLPWIMPVILSVVGLVGGAVKGYYEGLAAAGRRVAAVEEAVRLNAEGDARLATKVELGLNRAFVVLDDHDVRLPKLERRLDAIK